MVRLKEATGSSHWGCIAAAPRYPGCKIACWAFFPLRNAKGVHHQPAQWHWDVHGQTGTVWCGIMTVLLDSVKVPGRSSALLRQLFPPPSSDGTTEHLPLHSVKHGDRDQGFNSLFSSISCFSHPPSQGGFGDKLPF